MPTLTQVNKLIWPAPGGIGIHQQEQLEYMQESALRYGLINTTVSGLSPRLGRRSRDDILLPSA